MVRYNQVSSGDPKSQWGSSRNLTEPRAATNAVDHVPELPKTVTKFIGDCLKGSPRADASTVTTWSSKRSGRGQEGWRWHLLVSDKLMLSNGFNADAGGLGLWLDHCW